MTMRTRKKNWKQKSQEVCTSLNKIKAEKRFTDKFYKNLFFLKAGMETKFAKTDWEEQDKLIRMAIDHIIGFLEDQLTSKQNIARIAETHSHKNMDIHPHLYYYWIDAMIMTAKDLDADWYDDLAYYYRECLFFPVSFIISMYHK